MTYTLTINSWLITATYIIKVWTWEQVLLYVIIPSEILKWCEQNQVPHSVYTVQSWYEAKGNVLI